MIQYPIDFPVEVFIASPQDHQWSASAGPFDLTVAVPPEFGGPGGGFSPEDLFGLALANCFAATFSVFAKNSKLNFLSLRCKGILTVDRNSSGQPWMQKFHLQVELSIPEEEGSSRAERLLQKVSQSCLIWNSVLSEKKFEYQIRWPGDGRD
jgi:organic hydroperoxide reductase OsmC/OhrA